MYFIVMTKNSSCEALGVVDGGLSDEASGRILEVSEAMACTTFLRPSLDILSIMRGRGEDKVYSEGDCLVCGIRGDVLNGTCDVCSDVFELGQEYWESVVGE